jgi:hypothetical protein
VDYLAFTFQLKIFHVSLLPIFAPILNVEVKKLSYSHGDAFDLNDSWY